jgi:hypothetical protein
MLELRVVAVAKPNHVPSAPRLLQEHSCSAEVCRAVTTSIKLRLTDKMTGRSMAHLATVPIGPLSNSSAPTVLLKDRRRLLALSVPADHTAADLPLALAPVAIGEPDATPVAHLCGCTNGDSENRQHTVLSQCSELKLPCTGHHGHVVIHSLLCIPGNDERGVGLGCTHTHSHHLASFATWAHQAIALQVCSATALPECT